MSNFVDDLTDLDFPKESTRVVAPGQENKALRSSDWNTLCQAALDLRGAVLALRDGGGGVSANVKSSAYGATGDGVTDDRVAIQSAIDVVSVAGGGTVYLPNGTYIVTRKSAGEEGCLYIPSNITLMGESRTGVIIKLAAGQLGFTRPIRLNNANDVRITNLSINGNKSAQSVEEHRANIFAQGCSRLLIDRVTSYNAAGDAFDIHQDCFDVLLEDCYGYDTDRSGVALNGGRQKRVTIRNCQLINNLAQQVDSEMDVGEHIEDVTVENCHLVSQLDYAITISGQNESFQSDGFVVRNNIIEGCVFVVWAKNVRLENNKIIQRATDVAQPLAVTHKSENVVIEGNYIEYNSTEGVINPKTCIDLEGTTTTDKPTRVLIKGNTLKTTRNDANGLYITSSLVAEVVDNTILGTASNTQFGVEVRPTESDASYQMQSVVVNGNHIVDFAKGVVASGVSGSTTVKDLQVCNNVFEKIDNTGFTICIDIDVDNFHVVRQATVIGNSAIGVASMFGGAYGGWPVDIATLIGGNRGNCGVYSMAGTPESALTEVVGAMVLRRDGAAGTTLYTKESGSGNTGWVARASGVLAVQRFTGASGTYTPTAGTRKVRLRMTGAGGGGGAAQTGGAGTASFGSGGASGTYIEKWINPGALITGGAWTGAASGGAGGTGGTGNGATGTDATIIIQSVTYTAKGGPGGQGMATSSSPATLAYSFLDPDTSTAADFSSGQCGGQASRYANGIGHPGFGGSNPFGRGGALTSFSPNTGTAGTGFGAGGCGAVAWDTGNKDGGAGSGTLIIVEEYS